MSTFVSLSKTDHSGLTCRDTGCRVIQGWLLGVFAEAVIYIHTHVSTAFTWRDMLTGADSWLRGCPSLPLQIYDWEDLCPVQLILLIDSLVDFLRVDLCSVDASTVRGSALHPTYPHFTLHLNFTCPHGCVVLLWVALHLQPFTGNVIIYAPA